MSRVGGRRRPHRAAPRPRFAAFSGALPTPPASVDYGSKARASLSQMYGNNVLGDCVIAGGYHLIGIATGNASGEAFIASRANILADYGAIGGYRPGKPSTDNGCDEETAFAYWTKHGFADGSKLTGSVAIDARNRTEVMQAIDLFESVFFGVGLPAAWVDPMPQESGWTWDVAGPSVDGNGHAFVATGYDATGVTISTWGMIGKVSWEAVAAYAVPSAGGALYALLTPDLIAKGQAKAPNGFDWAALVADFAALGGHPMPAPAPAPPPPPAPGTCTLAQAQVALARGWGK